jgi:hypothetical protein
MGSIKLALKYVTFRFLLKTVKLTYASHEDIHTITVYRFFIYFRRRVFCAVVAEAEETTDDRKIAIEHDRLQIFVNV